MTTTGPELLLLAGLAPARMAASLAAPDPEVQISRFRFLTGELRSQRRKGERFAVAEEAGASATP